MFSLLTNVGCACVRKKSVTYENNDSCKQRLVIVLTLHIECNFNLKVFFFYFFFSFPLSPAFIISHSETVNCCNFLFVSTFVGDFGRELHCKRAARLSNLENKRRELRSDGFKMGVAATLPELSEWTLHQNDNNQTNVCACATSYSH